MIFWMENNYRRTGRGAGHAANELSNVPKALNVETTVIDGIDVGTVHTTAKEIVRRVRAGDGPLFVEARTHLWPGNAFNMPKLVGGLTDIAWTWNPALRRKGSRLAHRPRSDSELLSRREAEIENSIPVRRLTRRHASP
jgi:pyruvate dehydrogenase E1 component alpha subunit